jgi:DNA invertase Pin-like site-specific DNA recombinase
MKAVGYTRVSTNEQAENGVSLKAQEQRIREYCKAQGWQLIEIVRDDGCSAKDLKRPGLRRILEEFSQKRRRFQGIVVVKLDRLTRSVRDLVQLTDEAERHQVALVSIQEAVDTGTATGQLFRNIVTSISEWERNVIGERTREALAYKRRNGERIGSLPYGYAVAKDGTRLVEVPRELKVLTRIQRERARGLSFARIADNLNAERVPTKCKAKRGWLAGTVRSVLATTMRREAAFASDGARNRAQVKKAQA